MLAAVVGPGTAAHILVVGAGGGAQEIVTAGKLEPAWRFTAVDPSKPMVDIANAHLETHGLAGRTETHLGYVDDSLNARRCDAATLIGVLRHLPGDAAHRARDCGPLAARRSLDPRRKPLCLRRPSKSPDGLGRAMAYAGQHTRRSAGQARKNPARGRSSGIRGGRGRAACRDRVRSADLVLLQPVLGRLHCATGAISRKAAGPTARSSWICTVQNLSVPRPDQPRRSKLLCPSNEPQTNTVQMGSPHHLLRIKRQDLRNAAGLVRELVQRSLAGKDEAFCHDSEGEGLLGESDHKVQPS